MKLIIETKRLILRELTIDDAESLYQLNLNPNVIRFTGDVAFKDIWEAKDFLSNYSDYHKNGFGRWAVIDKSNREFLGWCGLKYDENRKETDIGFRFFEEQWNKGYGTESALACLMYGFGELGLKRIIGRSMAENTASVKVLEKVGLTFLREFDFDEMNKGVIYEIKKLRFCQLNPKRSIPNNCTVPRS